MDLKSSFETLLGITQQMQAAAEMQAWEKLTALEEERAGIIEKLPAKLSFKTSNEQYSIFALIKKIQVFDQSIRETVEPCREDVKNLLSRFEQKR